MELKRFATLVLAALLALPAAAQNGRSVGGPSVPQVPGTGAGASLGDASFKAPDLGAGASRIPVPLGPAASIGAAPAAALPAQGALQAAPKPGEARSERILRAAEQVGEAAEALSRRDVSAGQALEAGDRAFAAIHDGAPVRAGDDAPAVEAPPSADGARAGVLASPAQARALLGGDPKDAKVYTTFGGIEGAATLVELGGRKWVRKHWPARRERLDGKLEDYHAADRVKNELFYRELVRNWMGDLFQVAPRAVAVPDGKGGYHYFTEFVESTRSDEPRYESGLTDAQRRRLVALRFVFGLSDMHKSNVLFTRDPRPLLIDFEMAGDTGDNQTNKVFDRGELKAPTPAAAQNLVYFKSQPYLWKQSDRILSLDHFRGEVALWAARLEEPGFVADLRAAARRAGLSWEEQEAFLAAARANAANFDRNFGPLLEEVNKIQRHRREARLSGKLRSWLRVPGRVARDLARAFLPPFQPAFALA